MQDWRGEGVCFSAKTKQPRAVPACMCVHTCVCLHRTRANTSAGTQKLCCGPRSRREEGEETVQAWGLMLAGDSSNLKGAASEMPLEAFLSFPSLTFGKPGWVICQLYPCKDFAPEKEKSINSRWAVRRWDPEVRVEEQGAGRAGWEEQGAAPGKQLKLSRCEDHWPVLFFLFPGSCVFQNVLLCLGRCDVLGSSNYLGLSKVAVPKTKTKF